MTYWSSDRRLRLAPMAAAVLAVALTGCATKMDQQRQVVEQDRDKAAAAMSRPLVTAPQQRVVSVASPSIPVVERKLPRAGAWLRSVRVKVTVDDPLPVTEVLRMLSDQGLNIASDLPLQNYTWSGQVHDSDAESALHQILATVGLDYELDAGKRLVTIKPMPTRTWFLSLGNRRTTFSAGGSGSGAGSSGGAAAPSGSASGGAAGGTGGAASAAASSGASSMSSAGGGSIAFSSAENFWQSLATELAARLSIVTPGRGVQRLSPAGKGSPAMAMARPASPPAAAAMPMSPEPGQGSAQTDIMDAATRDTGAADSGKGVERKTVGAFTLNPETGAVMVSAPHWILNDLDTYLRRIQAMYNTEITFTGEVIAVTTNRANSAGLDVAAFGRWAQARYGAFIANNALGGINVSFPDGGLIPSVNASNALPGPIIGIRSALDGVQIFNAYLAELGNVSVVQKPVITTTSGVPAEFNKITTRYFNTVTQQAVGGGTGSAAVGTQNNLQAVELGTVLRINPRVDLSTGLIRAQLTFNQNTQSGTQNVAQTIAVGSGSQNVSTQVPIITRLSYAGEALLRDGDMIIVGGQSETAERVDESGLPAGDRVLGGLFGVKKRQSESATYFLALRVQSTQRQ